jgi:hypothetical protein
MKKRKARRIRSSNEIDIESEIIKPAMHMKK